MHHSKVAKDNLNFSLNFLLYWKIPYHNLQEKNQEFGHVFKFSNTSEYDNHYGHINHLIMGLVPLMAYMVHHVMAITLATTPFK